MKSSRLTLAVVALSFSIAITAAAADTVKARKRVEVGDTPAAVWEKIGEFCAIADWHPAVAQCEITEEDGDTYRLLTLADGAMIKEKHLGAGATDTSYSYQIVEGPLPVQEYTAVFEVKEDDDGAGIKWTAEFLADGVADDEAKDIIEGIFKAGLESIEEMY